MSGLSNHMTMIRKMLFKRQRGQSLHLAFTSRSVIQSPYIRQNAYPVGAGAARGERSPGDHRQFWHDDTSVIRRES